MPCEWQSTAVTPLSIYMLCGGFPGIKPWTAIDNSASTSGLQIQTARRKAEKKMVPSVICAF